MLYIDYTNIFYFIIIIKVILLKDFLKTKIWKSNHSFIFIPHFVKDPYYFLVK